MREENFKRHPNLSEFILEQRSFNILLVSELLKSYDKNGEFCGLRQSGTEKMSKKLKSLEYLGKQELERLSCQPKLFISETDTFINNILESLSNASIRVVGQCLHYRNLNI